MTSNGERPDWVSLEYQGNEVVTLEVNNTPEAGVIDDGMEPVLADLRKYVELRDKRPSSKVDGDEKDVQEDFGWERVDGNCSTVNADVGNVNRGL